MIKVILDTNVIVSAHLKPDGLERSVLNLALAEQIQLYVSAEIIAEYAQVLHRSKLKIDPDLVDESLQLIVAHANMVTPARALSVSPDEADNRFLECAEEAKADYLVTGNKRHFPKHWKSTVVVNARGFLEIITPELRR
jgi:putative PIN family toxin of toxin-antitoxin system